MKAHEIKVGMRYVEKAPPGWEETDVDSEVVDVEHLVSNKTGVTRGVTVTLADGSIIHWMDPDKEVGEVS